MRFRCATIFVFSCIVFILPQFGAKPAVAETGPTNYQELNEIMERICTQTINTARTLSNADACRRAATVFVDGNHTPNVGTLEFRNYKARYIQSICESPYLADGINGARDVKNQCYNDGVKEFAEHTKDHDLGLYCTDYWIKDPLSCNVNLLESIRRSTEVEMQILALMATRQNVQLEAFSANPEDGTSYAQLNNIIDRICTRTIKSRFSLSNGELCRKTALTFVIKYTVPSSVTLEFKSFKLGLVQSLCTAPYQKDVEDSTTDVQRMCWAASIDHFSIDSSCHRSDLICMQNAIANVKSSVESEIHIQARILSYK